MNLMFAVFQKAKRTRRMEFGCTGSMAVTHKEGLALDVGALAGNPYAGHSLKDAIKRS